MKAAHWAGKMVSLMAAWLVETMAVLRDASKVGHWAVYLASKRAAQKAAWMG
jgi:hypothetical protein